MKSKRVRIVERKLGRERAWGTAIPEERAIEIDPRLPARRYLTILVHELLHVAAPDASETWVASRARWMARALWAQRFRRLAR